MGIALLTCGVLLCMEQSGYAQPENERPANRTAEVALEDVEVSGTKSRGLIEEKKSEPRTESTVTKDAIQKLGDRRRCRCIRRSACCHRLLLRRLIHMGSIHARPSTSECGGSRPRERR